MAAERSWAIHFAYIIWHRIVTSNSKLYRLYTHRSHRKSENVRLDGGLPLGALVKPYLPKDAAVIGKFSKIIISNAAGMSSVFFSLRSNFRPET